MQSDVYTNDTTPGGGDGTDAVSVAGRSAAATADRMSNDYPVWPGCRDRERPVRRAAHWAVVAAGKPTHRARMLPGFLIVGAERGGTTSMHYYLSQHPALFSSILPKKEVHFFDLAYHRGVSWYRAHFPLTARARLRTRSMGVAPVAFEGSPYYMFHPLAPGRIQRELPGVRLIVLLRDPVERAYSAHSNQLGMGHETEPFERALELEDARLAGEAERLASDPSYYSRRHWLFSYRTRGQYIEQLERLERLFGRERIHVIDSGDFFADPESTYLETLAFLGVPPLGKPVFIPRNGRIRSPMPESLRTALEEHYRPYDERLTGWLGREPSWRRTRSG